MMDVIKKIRLARWQLEILLLVIMVICGLSVFTIKLGSQTSLTYDDGKISYTGHVVNHRMNGQGKLTYANGDTYEGNFVNGVFDGQGTFTSNVGWTYEGSFKNGQADGQGKLTAKDQQVYQGEFKQGIYQK